MKKPAMPVYETHEGVTLKRVRVTQNAYFVGGKLMVQEGAIGLLAGSALMPFDSCITFEYHKDLNSGLHIALDGSGRQIQTICNSAFTEIWE